MTLIGRDTKNNSKPDTTMKTIEIDLYEFAELSERAQEKALDDFRDIELNGDWYEFVFDDIKCIGQMIGISIANIGFSGFSSQGDGAHLVGSYQYAPGSVHALMQYAPIDPEPVRIARELQSIQRPKFYGVEASVTHRGYYQHENCTEINVFDRGSWADGETEEAVKDCLRDFMRWIYSQLESEYEYLTSDECVRDSIEANEYTFTKDGAVCSASADCRRHRTDEAYRLTRYRPACTAGYIMTIKRDRSMETTRSLAEYPEPHVQHIMELVRRELSHYGFTRTPTDTEIRAMIRSGMTMCGIYGACCDVMAGFDLYESIEANREATQ